MPLIQNLDAGLTFADILILTMAFPHALGCLLSGQAKRAIAVGWRRLRIGNMPTRFEFPRPILPNILSEDTAG